MFVRTSRHSGTLCSQAYYRAGLEKLGDAPTKTNPKTVYSMQNRDEMKNRLSEDMHSKRREYMKLYEVKEKRQQYKRMYYLANREKKREYYQKNRLQYQLNQRTKTSEPNTFFLSF
jgi:hypothetical protein